MEHKNIHEALLAFAQEFHGAKKTGTNPHFRSQHFELDELVRVTNPILHQHGLYVRHSVKDNQVGTVIGFTGDGSEMFSEIPIPANLDAQKIGGAITYFKRYNLCALLNISEADDDGNDASAPVKETPKRPELPTQPAADEAQRLLIQDYIEAGHIGEEAKEELRKMWPTLTKSGAAEIIRNLKKENK